MLFASINRLVKHYVEGRDSRWPAVRKAHLVFVLVAACLFAASILAQHADSPSVTLPCRVVSVYDGDTLDAEVTIRLKVRLLDCWAPEMNGDDKASGIKSRDKLRTLALGRQGTIAIPLAMIQNAVKVEESVTFGRWLARVKVEGKDLSEQMVRGGYATKTKSP